MSADENFDNISQQYSRNSRIMLTAVICLFFVVVLVLILHLYVRCILRRRAGRRAVSRRVVFALASSDGDARTDPAKTGLDSTVLAALPVFVFTKLNRAELSLIECAVCLSALEENETARLLPNCNHTFHAECIDMWLQYHSTCPICRTPAEPRNPGSPATSGPAGPSEPARDSVNHSVSGDLGNATARRSKDSGSSSSRLSSFRRMLTRERSDRRFQEDAVDDLERQ